MKPKIAFPIIFATVAAALFCQIVGIQAQAQSAFRPAKVPSNPPVDPSLTLEFTVEELATPPAGEIKKLFLREINALRAGMAADLATVPDGNEGAGSPWFPKFAAYKNGLDTLAASRLQADCFTLIPIISDVMPARDPDQNAPQFFAERAGCASAFGYTLLHAIAQHVTEQNGAVSTANHALFIKVFTTGGYWGGVGLGGRGIAGGCRWYHDIGCRLHGSATEDTALSQG
jgi:hypothetical protein